VRNLFSIMNFYYIENLGFDILIKWCLSMDGIE